MLYQSEINKSIYKLNIKITNKQNFKVLAVVKGIIIKDIIINGNISSVTFTLSLDLYHSHDDYDVKHISLFAVNTKTRRTAGLDRHFFRMSDMSSFYAGHSVLQARS